jgi:hypothetical protein
VARDYKSQRASFPIPNNPEAKTYRIKDSNNFYLKLDGILETEKLDDSD